MIFFESYHFIVPLKLLEAKYPGGLEYFKKDVPNTTYFDDGQIATVRFLLREEINEFVDLVARKGLHFQRQEFYSDDFTVFTPVGAWWKLKNLVSDIIYCHLNE
nr:hypothetical protein [uncultured Pedobacter sp.]